MISHLAQSLARDSAIHNSRPRPSSARSARTGHGYSESTEADGSISELLKRARYAPHLVTLPKLPTAAEGVVPRAPEFPECSRPVSYLAKDGVQVELRLWIGYIGFLGLCLQFESSRRCLAESSLVFMLIISREGQQANKN